MNRIRGTLCGDHCFDFEYFLAICSRRYRGRHFNDGYGFGYAQLAVSAYFVEQSAAQAIYSQCPSTLRTCVIFPCHCKGAVTFRGGQRSYMQIQSPTTTESHLVKLNEKNDHQILKPHLLHFQMRDS